MFLKPGTWNGRSSRKSCRPSTLCPTSEGRDDAPLIGETWHLDFCAVAVTGRPGHVAAKQLPSRVAVVLSLKEAGAQREEGLPFRSSSLRTPCWNTAHLPWRVLSSLLRGSGMLRIPILCLAKEGGVPGGSMGLSLSLLPHVEHWTAWMTSLCQVAGALGTRDPFLKGWGREDVPMSQRVPY